MTKTGTKAVCPHCRKTFRVNRPHQKYDSAKCQMAAWTKRHPRVLARP